MVRFRFVDENDPHLITLATGGSEEGFILDWAAELGWDANPFRPTGIIVGDMAEERKEINLFFVKNQRFGLIRGGEGMGKSLLLRWLSKELDGYPDITHVLIDARDDGGKAFRDAIAEPLRGMLDRKDVSDDEALLELVKKRSKGVLALLVDDAQKLTKENRKTIRQLLTTETAVILATDTKLEGMPEDELGLVLSDRTPEQYQQILSTLIAAVGGEGISPFTEDVVERMARDTDTVREFLGLAEETAVNVALKRSEVPEDVTVESLTEEEEPVAERKRGIKEKRAAPDGSSKDAREYDKLVESLAADLE